jgi:hypothetical protein
MSEPGDDHLTRAEEELGTPDAIFRISRARFTTKLWTGIALILGSSVLIAFLIVMNWFDAALLAKLILAPLVVGIGILVTMYRQRGLIVMIYPTGLLRLQRGAVDSFPWDEISGVRLKIQRLDAAEIVYGPDGEPVAAWLPSEAPAFLVWKAGLTLERFDGTEAHISPALADYDRLAELVQRRTFARTYAAVRDKLLAGEAVLFGDLEMSSRGFRYTTKSLRWRDFKEIVVAQGKLTIKKEGGWIPWAIMDVSRVPNPHVLFAIAAEARRWFKTSKKKQRDAGAASTPAGGG